MPAFIQNSTAIAINKKNILECEVKVIFEKE
jgi:hypothetical protein